MKVGQNMEIIHELDFEKDIDFFVDFYNESVIYSPYSARLDNNTALKYVLKNVDFLNEFILLYNCIDKKGIIHFAVNSKNEGIIFLLLASTASVAGELLIKAEQYLRDKKVTYVKSFLYDYDPYKFFLHGVEPFIWAGWYPSTNAFLRQEYDLAIDIVMMSVVLAEAPCGVYCENAKISVSENIIMDSEIGMHGQFIAYCEGKAIGRCGYYDLRYISSSIGKKFGQIDIWINREFQSTQISRQLITLAHRKLYDMGTKNIILTTNQAFFKAIKFYESVGYKAEAVRGYWYDKELL